MISTLINLWSEKESNNESEEFLLPASLASTSTFPGPDFTSTARWKRLPKLLLGVLWQLLLFTIPSFLKRTSKLAHIPSGTAAQQTSPNTSRHSTVYLDGVRGLASLIVFIDHWSTVSWNATHAGYEDAQKSSLWQLPVVRLIYSGPAMVSIFFVVSGYVLTHRFIQKMYRHEYESLFSGLTSLTFRRTIRLFLPALVSSLLMYVCASLHLMEIPGRVSKQKFHHGLAALMYYLDKTSDPWTWDIFTKGWYNPQLWSIGIEYRGSMVVFLIVLGLARCRTIVRMTVQLGIIIHAFGHQRWDVALFVAGMLVAEIDVFVNQAASRKVFMQQKRIKIVLYLMMLVGIWVSGFPRDNPLKSLGYTFFSNLPPHNVYRRRFWLAIASVLIVGPMPYLPTVQAFFSTRVIRYLGKISFALYLVHILGNRTMGTWLLHVVSSILGKEGYWANVLSFAISSLVYVPIIFWWSDMFWRAVDIPSTKFAKWFEGKCASTGSEDRKAMSDAGRSTEGLR